MAANILDVEHIPDMGNGVAKYHMKAAADILNK